MPKHFFEDMVKAKRLSKGMVPKEPELKETRKPEVKEIKKIIKTEIKTNPSKNMPRYFLWLIALVSVIFCFFAFSFFFSKATVTVNPKTEDIVLNENLSASKDSNNNGLFFNLVDNISGEESKAIQANVQKDVSYNATGTVVIYNAFSSSPQALSIDTRLEGSNGKIYKTQTKIIVPGMNKDKTPGQVEVGVYGSAAGPDYNSAPLDFNILGFKGTPKYSTFKVRSKTEIAGGFIGKVNTISDADKASAIAELNSSLKEKLLAKAGSQIPSGFVLFKDAVFLSTEDPIIPLTADKNNNFTITEKGSLYGILFNEQRLTKKIAADRIDSYDGSDVYISNIKDLTFSFSNQGGISPDSLQNINFNLSGKASFVWKLDTAKFITDLLGKSKNDFSQILSQYPDIISATLKLSPPWKMSIPNEIKNIKVNVNYPI